VRPALLVMGALLGAVLPACAGQPAPQVGAAASAKATPPRLISTEVLAQWREKPMTILDVRPDMFTYLKDHLPGAEYLNIESLRAAQRGIPAQLLSPEAYAQLFGRLGLSRDKPVVIYSAGESRNIDATFVSWLLAAFGYPEVYVLNGGYFKWQLEQRALVPQYPQVTPTNFPPTPFRPEEASLEDVRQTLNGGNAILVDARPGDQYAGEAGAQMRRGHIPGAVSHYWQEDLTQEGFGHVWKSASTLRSEYAAQGITPEKDIIVYCNSTTEASHVHFTLRYLLQYPRVRIYTGSWTEWAAQTELPVETGRQTHPR
jgi:thiosulfate/3-mercaptopyruvate sulfurtransferase